jgi:hypothetical protein
VNLNFTKSDSYETQYITYSLPLTVEQTLLGTIDCLISAFCDLGIMNLVIGPVEMHNRCHKAYVQVLLVFLGFFSVTRV